MFRTWTSWLLILQQSLAASRWLLYGSSKLPMAMKKCKRTGRLGRTFLECKAELLHLPSAASERSMWLLHNPSSPNVCANQTFSNGKDQSDNVARRCDLLPLTGSWKLSCASRTTAPTLDGLQEQERIKTFWALSRYECVRRVQMPKFLLFAPKRQRCLRSREPTTRGNSDIRRWDQPLGQSISYILTNGTRIQHTISWLAKFYECVNTSFWVSRQLW